MSEFSALFPVDAHAITAAKEAALSGLPLNEKHPKNWLDSVRELLTVDLNTSSGSCFINLKGRTRCPSDPLNMQLRVRTEKLW